MRAASADEAAFVARLSRDLGLAHRTLRWEGPKPRANVAAEARAARYGLLADHAGAIGAAAVLTAHHEDDQIETHHLAMLRRAGDRGLAGMRVARSLAPDLRLLRPFLEVPGAALKAAVAARGLAAIEDPSNRDMRFARARLRAASGLDRQERRRVLARIADHAARRDAEDAALGGAVRTFRRDHALSVDDRGVVRLARDAFRAMDPCLADVLLSRLLRAAGGGEYAPPREAVRRLADRLRARSLAGATLGGAVVAAGGELVLHREYGRGGIADRPFPEKGAAAFDRRMAVRLPDGGGGRADGLRLVAFGCTGRGNAVEKTLPAVADGTGCLVAAHPHLVRKLPETMDALDVSEEVSFRFLADLPSEAEA